MSSVLVKEIELFHSQLKTETDVSRFLSKLKEIAARFSILDEENNLSGCFTTILGLTEQYNHELIARHSENEHVHS